jgi:hypothetical protein
VFTDGEPIVIGIDIGGERADSAVVWINERLHVGCEVLSGDRAVLDIAEVVRELAAQYRIIECCFDPWRAGQIGQELEQRGIKQVGASARRLRPQCGWPSVHEPGLVAAVRGERRGHEHEPDPVRGRAAGRGGEDRGELVAAKKRKRKPAGEETPPKRKGLSSGLKAAAVRRSPPRGRRR